MTEADAHRRATQERFGDRAALYVDSTTHAGGADLERVQELAAAGPGTRALDIATGGGHTARIIAGDGAWTVATDLATDMLRAARGHFADRGVAVRVSAAAAEALPFTDAVFDVVTCRTAPHHFAGPAAFVRETARVLKPGGAFVMEDHRGLDDPREAAWLDARERQRDPTHVEAYTETQWRAWCAEAKLEVDVMETYVKMHDFAEWCARQRMSAAETDALHAAFLEAPPALARRLGYEVEAGRLVRWGGDMLILRARRAA